MKTYTSFEIGYYAKGKRYRPNCKNNAFAIFAGFEIDPTEEEKRLSNDKFWL